MQIKVNREKCTGHGRCWSLAPEVYDADDNGFIEAPEDGVVNVPAGHEDAALLGVRSCPEHALSVVESS